MLREKDVPSSMRAVGVQVFEGNADAYGVKHTYLDDVIVLRYVKFHPVTWHRHPSMRVEIVGCQGHRHTHIRLTALFWDYPGEPVPER